MLTHVLRATFSTDVVTGTMLCI